MEAEDVAPDEIVYRLLGKKWLSARPDGGEIEVSIKAFLRRKNIGGTGDVEEYLSVNRERIVSPSSSMAASAGRFAAACRIQVESIVQFGLNVRPEPIPDNPGHAGIFGIPAPPYDETTQAAADSIAVKLCSVIISVEYANLDMASAIRKRDLV